MGSRIGSIAIFLVIAGIVAAVVLVINRLDLLNTGEPDDAIMIISLDEGELLLLDEPRSITVTISSGNPIATLELFVDELKISEVIPPYSQDRGVWIGSFVWTPDRLGFANVRIVSLDADGVESIGEVRVEVTDCRECVEAALQVTIEGIEPLQQFPAGSTILLRISASGSQPIERFDMLVNGNFVIAVTPIFDEGSGKYKADIEWTHPREGEVTVTITAIDIAGRTKSQTVPVVLIGEGGQPPTAESADQREDEPSEERPPPSDETDGQIGEARIESPREGQQFSLDADFSFDVELRATNVGTVASVLLYLTPIAPDNTLGSSVLIHSSEGHEQGSYSERVPDVERWITSSGSYELQLVVFTPENERYDHRIVIHVVATAEQEADEPGDDEPSISDEVDLAIITARQTNEDGVRLNVSITNRSAVDIERTDVLIIVVDTNSGAELASATVTLGIEPDGVRTIPLDLELEPGEQVEALVVLEAAVDSDASNNTFEVSLVGPDPGAQDEQQAQEEADGRETGESDDQPETTQSEQPSARPDLAFLDAQTTSDGYVLLTVINDGDEAAETFSVLITNQDGELLEVIERRAADAMPLAPGETEILTSLESHSGVITIVVVVGGDIPDQDLENNMMTLEVGD